MPALAEQKITQSSGKMILTANHAKYTNPEGIRGNRIIRRRQGHGGQALSKFCDDFCPARSRPVKVNQTDLAGVGRHIPGRQTSKNQELNSAGEVLLCSRRK